eukprot:scaffold92064_cov55-Attheya_sp.AAC.2
MICSVANRVPYSIRLGKLECLRIVLGRHNHAAALQTRERRGPTDGFDNMTYLLLYLVSKVYDE